MHHRDAMDSLLAGLLAALSLTATACVEKESPEPEPTPPPFACESPQPRSGFEVCAGGWMHRPEILECASALPRPTMCSGEGGECQQDADCTALANGMCETGFEGECYCDYGCRNDAECDAGQICMCGETIGECVAAECTSDADCAEGYCVNYDASPGCNETTFACQTAADECVSAEDCEGQFMECSIEEGATQRLCVEQSCAIGRPFLVEAAVRVAPTVARGDWHATPTVAVAGLSAADRAALADHWTRAGAMEHASIAAFARFALQLLAMGAPPRLISDAQAAMRDELGHARVCFGLAGAYAGRAVGPGALDVRGALAGAARDFVTTAILEGCVGETVAALEASEAARHAEDPAVRAALEQISIDEGRHAELAWRFVQWAVQRDPALREVAAQAFAAAQADSSADEPGREDLLRLGVVGPRRRASLRREALARVVGPCARGLLAQPPAPALTLAMSA